MTVGAELGGLGVTGTPGGMWDTGDPGVMGEGVPGTHWVALGDASYPLVTAGGSWGSSGDHSVGSQRLRGCWGKGALGPPGVMVGGTEGTLG